MRIHNTVAMKFSGGISVVLFLCILFAGEGCTDFVQIDPPPEILSADNAFLDDSIATASIRGIYSTMIEGEQFASGDWAGVTYITGLSADELIWEPVSDELLSFANNDLSPGNSYGLGLWSSCYKIIYYANTVLEGLAVSDGVTAVTRARLEGEAKFLRGFAYFYLVNLYGKAPLILNTDYQTNSGVAREPVSVVYGQIVADLTAASELIEEDYPKGRRTRANRWTAHAMLARVYLYTGEWQKAEEHASAVIGSGVYMLEPVVTDVFLAGSQEAIWQLKPVLPGINTWEAIIFSGTSALNPAVMDWFESDDRRLEWVDTTVLDTGNGYYPNKYRIVYVPPDGAVEEYSMVLRLAEQYLIRAEARTHLHNVAGAIEDVDMIRARAELPLLADTNPGADEAAVLVAIAQERRIEFLAEWGHRWLDLKRTGTADAVLGAAKGAFWQPTDVLYPVPEYEIQNDPHLLPQNDGY